MADEPTESQTEGGPADAEPASAPPADVAPPQDAPSAAPADAAAASVEAVAPAAPAGADRRLHRAPRSMTGVVVSNKADKTISVRIERRVKHPVYGKFVRRSTRLAAHDQNNDCQEGDVVTILETRPISKSKSWRLASIVERASAIGRSQR